MFASALCAGLLHKLWKLWRRERARLMEQASSLDPMRRELAKIGKRVVDFYWRLILAPLSFHGFNTQHTALHWIAVAFALGLCGRRRRLPQTLQEAIV